MIAVERRADDRLLEGMEGVDVVDLGGTAVQREPGGRPVIDPVVAERAAGRVDQVIVRLAQQIDEIAEHGGGDKAARHGDDSGRDDGNPHGRYGTPAALPLR